MDDDRQLGAHGHHPLSCLVELLGATGVVVGGALDVAQGLGDLLDAGKLLGGDERDLAGRVRAGHL